MTAFDPNDFSVSICWTLTDEEARTWRDFLRGPRRVHRWRGRRFVTRCWP